MSNPRVWVLKEQVIGTKNGARPMDLTPAMAYGDLEFVTVTDQPTYGKSSVLDAWRKAVDRFVEEYDEVNDFIVPTGQPSAIFAIGWLLGRAGKVPRFLQWRREENRYQVLNLGLGFENV